MPPRPSRPQSRYRPKSGASVSLPCNPTNRPRPVDLVVCGGRTAILGGAPAAPVFGPVTTPRGGDGRRSADGRDARSEPAGALHAAQAPEHLATRVSGASLVVPRGGREGNAAPRGGVADPPGQGRQQRELHAVGALPVVVGEHGLGRVEEQVSRGDA